METQLTVWLDHYCSDYNVSILLYVWQQFT